MPDISKFEIDGVIHNIKDAEAQERIEEIIATGAGDWNQNDPSGKGYIKNRTHWKEEGNGQLIVPETTVDFSGSGTTLQTATAAADSLSAGDKVPVLWNGKTYTCECWIYLGYPCLGNGSITVASLEDTGEPFHFVFQYNGNVTINKNTGTAETISLKVGGTETIYHKLDRNYLPDDLGGGADWNASEGEPGHVRHRTHWAERGEGIHEILPELTAEFAEGDITGAGEVLLPHPLDLTEGKTYTVIWDGVKYECVCQYLRGHADNIYMEALTLGNASVVGGPDGGEPFIIGTILTPMNVGLVISVNDYSSHTVKVEGYNEIVHKLNNKFLDLDWLPVRGDILPAQTITTAMGDEVGAAGVIRNAENLDALEKGASVIVVVNGVSHNAIVSTDTDGKYIVPTDDGEFTLVGILRTWYFVTTTPGTYTVSVHGASRANKMPEDFLPVNVPAIQSANLGQIIVVDSVDELGRPTKWRATDLPEPKDGVSPTVNVSQIDNGHRVTITDAEGVETFDVMNGEKGDVGETGPRGETGPTGPAGSDATVTAANIESALGYTPADVTDIFESALQPAFTNIFDSVEIEYGKQMSAQGVVTETSAALATTDFISIKSGDVIRMEDFALYATGSVRICVFDSSKTIITSVNVAAMTDTSYYLRLPVKDESGNVTEFTVSKPSNGFIRICTNTGVIGANPVLTINEEITYEVGYGTKLNPKVLVDQSQILNAPVKNCWSILPYERLNICYSSINRKPINTVEHFTDAATNFGYNALKCDVRPTSDGELVCCHDAGFTFNSSGKITSYDSANATAIHSVTAETVLGYSFPTGEHPCLVGDYLDVCRTYGKVAFITIRNEYMDVVIPKLLDELRIHNMTHSTIINCMTYESLVQWRAQDQAVMINYTLNFGVAIDQTQIDRAIGLGYCSLCGFGLTSSTLEPNHTCDFEYARANGIRLLQAIAYKEGSPEACYAMGYDGCQIGIPWNPKSSGGGTVDAYTKAEIDAIMGSYITDINNLVGGGS